MMKQVLCGFAACAVAVGTAAAQPQPPQPPPPAGPEPPPAVTQQEPPPAQAPVQRSPAPMAAPEPVDDDRPAGMSLAIGLGYALPTSLQTPNITSVRLRLPSGVQIEPRLAIASSSTEVDTGESMTDKSSELGVSVLGRFPLVAHGRVDLEGCAGLTLNRAATRPESDLDVTVSTFGLSYGLAVSAWLTRHWQVSLTAMNPLITTTKRDADNMTGNTVTTTTTFGLVFDPTVALMVHLYH